MGHALWNFADVTHCYIVLYRLIMILLNRWTRLFHFTRPSLSSINSRVNLEGIMQQRLAKAIKRVNQQTLQQFTLPELIQDKLKVERNESSLISQRSVTLSIVNPRTLEHREVEFRLDQQLTDLKLEPTQFGFGFGTSDNQMKHFSKDRGVPAIDELKEYLLNDRQLLMFNLPENISQQDIRVMLKENVQSIELKYCVLGMPAYARVQFESKQILEKCLDKISNKQVQFGERVARIKTQEDEQRLRLANRRLVVHLQENDNIQKTLVEMSRFGRVMHIDWPLQASMNPSIEDVKDFYKNSRDLVKINRYFPDGRVESEYYPEVKVWKGNEDEREEENIIDRAQQLREAYDNRARFAKEVSVWAGKQHQLNFKHRGYCVVTFSTSEECQNYYFTHGARTKMSLVGERCEFEYDPLFRKQVLRVIDNENLISDKNHKGKQKKVRNNLDKEVQQEVDYYNMSEQQVNMKRANESYNLLHRLILKYFYDDALTKTQNQMHFAWLEQENQLWEWENDLRLKRRQKNDQPTLTFDELAEKQLYGRVLPKNQKIERIKIEESKYRVPREEQLLKEFNLLTDSYDLSNRAKSYARQRERNNRLADQALGIVREGQQSETGQYEEEPSEGEVSEHDGENVGKHHFSTYRPQQIFRKRNADEEATYLRRYGQFVRGLIYEYMGVFQDKILQQTVAGNLTTMNPQSLTFLDGTPFLTEEQILDVLQFRRDFIVAQSDYEDFVYGNEYFKSSGINLKSIMSDYKQFEASALKQLSEVGVVEEMRKVSQTEDLQKKIDILNNQIADFGEQYKEEVIEDQTYLTKIRKLEHLIPLDRLAHLEKVVQKFDGQIDEKQAQVFQKHYKKMRETGVVSDEVCQAFGVEKGLSVDDLMSKMGQQYQVWRKDLDMLDRMRTYSSDSLKDDLRKQRRLAKNRPKKVGSYDYAKDPSEIYVKDREGYYKVSRFRQV